MKRFFFWCIMIGALTVEAQPSKTKNVILITLDGYRWKELFGGAEQDIIHDPKYVTDLSVQQQFGGESSSERRERLMPFFWGVIAREGQLYGNRNLRNKVNCKNNHLLSYPGYSEMLVGFEEPSISGNDKVENPNYTVLEFIQRHHSFKNQVAAFASWDTFPYILRSEESDFHVNAGHKKAEGMISDREKWMNENLDALMFSAGSRYDSTTFQYAFQFLKRERPRVMFIGLDETDSWGHAGRYDEYLKAANRADQMIGELWQWLQAQPDYKDQTTLLITTDHGRGKSKGLWRHHKLFAPGSRHIWFAVIGPDTPPSGEMKTKGKYFQKQVAKTVAAFLGIRYQHTKPVGEVVESMLTVSATKDSSTAINASSTEEKLPGSNR